MDGSWIPRRGGPGAIGDGREEELGGAAPCGGRGGGAREFLKRLKCEGARLAGAERERGSSLAGERSDVGLDRGAGREFKQGDGGEVQRDGHGAEVVVVGDVGREKGGLGGRERWKCGGRHTENVRYMKG